MPIQPVTALAIAAAARLMAEGGVIVFPTDTVYGLACDLRDAAAVERIYRIKGRPARLPLIAMLAAAEDGSRVAAALPARARRFMAAFWPGPLTIIVPAREDLPEVLLGGGRTIGLRIPRPMAWRDCRPC